MFKRLQEGLISGIGNWLADEALYQSRIHPEQPVSTMTDQQMETLHTSLKGILELAVSVDSDAGRYPKDWLFHFRWSGKKPVSIGGRPVHFVTVGL